MKKILVYLCLSCVSLVAFADKIVLDNKTNYPDQSHPGKIAIQWATSVTDTQEANKIIIHGSKLDSSSLMLLSKKGSMQLTPPDHAHYFRLMVWSTGKQEPDLLTNWVDIIPNKIYTVNQDHLVPTVLISGAGC
ncbi:MAG: hypothetical protein EPN84_09735 [Legionella sp.]|nr:MAG: hypothetical protein EPN84_09735 [Legionella sp.]